MKARFPCTLVLLQLDGQSWVGEALMLPGLSRLSETERQATHAAESATAAMAAQLSPMAWQRLLLPGQATLSEVTLEMKPPRRDPAWSTPVSCRFHVVHWSPASHHHLAWVPALSLMVQSRRLEDMPATLEEEIRGALMRTEAATSLEALTCLARPTQVALHPVTLNVEAHQPRERAIEARRKRQKGSALEEVATNLTQARLRPAFEVEADLRRLAEVLLPPSSRSVLLVGDSGTGKTARVHQLVLERDRHGLGRHTFWGTSGARLVAGMGGFGDWEARVQRIQAELKQARAILYVGNLVELTDVGKSTGHAYGVASVLRPAIARGEIRVLAECTPEQRDMLARDDPALIEAFAQFPVPEPDEAPARRILEKTAAIPADAMDVLLRLHRRYATYSAWPGRPLRFLRAVLQAGPVSPASVLEAFADETGLPRVLLDPAIPMVREEVRDWFASRVLEQDEAVDAVVDLLLVVKATLNRPHRPLASFLFLGPTGVGKTELCRTLAEYLFADRNRLVRFDMSEFAQPHSIDRLVGREGQLVGRVREQPFCVLLFDEFEKADPLFFDLLLQMLGDGRLTDALGRVADFRNAVVVMTSNLGAQAWLQGEPGFVQSRDGAARAHQHFVHAVQSFLRPELYNRIDRVVPFSPLSREGGRRIVERELERMLARDGIKYRNLQLQIDEAVAPWVLEESFDRRYGARTLRRFLEQRVLGPLADRLNEVPSERPVEARLSVVEGNLAVALAVGVPRIHAGFAAVTAWRTLRRQAQRLQACQAVAGLHNRLARLRQKRQRAEWEERFLAQLEALLADIDEVSTELSQQEDIVLLALYQDGEGVPGEVPPHEARLRDLVLSVFEWQTGMGNEVTLGVYGESVRHRGLLAHAYVQAGLAAGYEVAVAPVEVTPDPGFTVALHGRRAEADAIQLIKLLRLHLSLGLKEAKMLVDALQITTSQIGSPRVFLGDSFSSAQAQALRADFLMAGAWASSTATGDKLALGPSVPGAEFDPQGGVGWAIHLHGRLAMDRLGGEAGVHTFADRDGKHAVIVHVDEEELDDYSPPPDAHRRAFADDKPRRRTYRLEAQETDDPQTGRNLPMGGDLAPFLSRLLDDRLWREAWRLLEQPAS
ncbi:MAG TPA: AAA family ATPase [Candidatus Xenobia bacterium]|jgi:ATP-dependent Clp protease ATP-binding subunit ClpA/ribosomal protein L7/L12